jgi:hypothetical protein
MASRGNTQGESLSESQVRSTKEELVAEIQRLTDRLREQQDQINQQAVTAKAGKKGWMISTPNENYTGRTAGVYFENGHAFIPEDMHDARKKVAILTGDFGYSYTETTDGQEVKAPAVQKQNVFQASGAPTLLR